MTDYFVKNAGDDAKDGLSDANAWKTLAKADNGAYSGDDTISFKAGDEWREQFSPPSAGTDGHLITWGRYGEGADPIINATDVVTGWEGGITAPVAFWNLNEESGTRVDSAGSNDLTDNETVTYGTGKLGNCARFDEANDEYLSIADNADLSMGDIDFTIGIWVKLDDMTGDRRIVSKWDYAGSEREYFMGYDQSDDRFQFFVSPNGSDSTEVQADNFGGPSTGVWYFVLFWHDATANTINIQVDNGTVDSESYSTGVHQGTASFDLGRMLGSGGTFMDGDLDECFVIKAVLTANQRTVLYNGGTPWGYPLQNIWRAGHTPTDGAYARMVFFDGTKGTVEDKIGDLGTANEWYYDATNNWLFVYSSGGDPDTEYTTPGIEAGKREFGIECGTGDDYNKFENITIKGAHGFGLRLANCEGCVADSVDASYNMYGIQIDYAGAANNTLQDCTTNYCGPGTQDDGFVEGYGMVVYDGAHDTTIDGATSNNNTGDGIKFGMNLDEDNHCGTGNLIQNSTLNNNGEEGIDIIGGCEEVTVEAVTCTGNGHNGIILHGDGDTRNPTSCIVRYCNVHTNGKDGILSDWSDTCEYYYNLLHNNGDDGLRIAGNVSPEVYNNVIYDNDEDGIEITTRGGGAVETDDALVKNNIISSNGAVQMNINSAGGTPVFDYNCIYPEAVGFIHWDGSDYDDLATYVAAESQDANSIKDDPLMTDPANDDFTLQVTSPCINAGVDVSLTEDYAGDHVPVASPEIGAYEVANNPQYAYGQQ